MRTNDDKRLTERFGTIERVESPSKNPEATWSTPSERSDARGRGSLPEAARLEHQSERSDATEKGIRARWR